MKHVEALLKRFLFVLYYKPWYFATLFQYYLYTGSLVVIALRVAFTDSQKTLLYDAKHMLIPKNIFLISNTFSLNRTPVLLIFGIINLQYSNRFNWKSILFGIRRFKVFKILPACVFVFIFWKSTAAIMHKLYCLLLTNSVAGWKIFYHF